MSNEDASKIFKILSLGESGVGKTCLIQRYIDNKYDNNQISTIGIDFKPKIVKFKGKSLKLKIWDTAGQERYRNLTQQYYKNADGILLMFDLSKHESFNTINYWIDQIKAFSHIEFTPILLIGTKSDIEKREVTSAESKEISEKYGLKFFESSAQENTGITEIFEYLCEKIFELKSSYIYDVGGKRQTIIIDPKKDKENKKKWC